MFNRHPRKAISLAINEDDSDAEDAKEIAGDGDSDEEETEDMDAVMEKLLDIRDRCHHKAKENIGAAQEKQKWQYDKKHNALKVIIKIWDQYMHK